MGGRTDRSFEECLALANYMTLWLAINDAENDS